MHLSLTRLQHSSRSLTSAAASRISRMSFNPASSVKPARPKSELRIRSRYSCEPGKKAFNISLKGSRTPLLLANANASPMTSSNPARKKFPASFMLEASAKLAGNFFLAGLLEVIENHAGGVRINHLPGARERFRLSSEKRDQLARSGGI